MLDALMIEGDWDANDGAETTRTHGSLNKYTEFTEALATGQTVCRRSYKYAYHVSRMFERQTEITSNGSSTTHITRAYSTV